MTTMRALVTSSHIQDPTEPTEVSNQLNGTRVAGGKTGFVNLTLESHGNAMAFSEAMKEHHGKSILVEVRIVDAIET